MNLEMLVFDMDGVLVDPTETFRRALIETVRHFAQVEMSQEDIVRIKNGGGYNDDSEIALMAIRSGGASTLTPAEVRACGQAHLYWGQDGDGLVIRNERWLVRAGDCWNGWRRVPVASESSPVARTAIDAAHAEQILSRRSQFDPIVTNEQVENLKPAPDGLLFIQQATASEAETGLRRRQYRRLPLGPQIGGSALRRHRRSRHAAPRGNQGAVRESGGGGRAGKRQPTGGLPCDDPTAHCPHRAQHQGDPRLGGTER